jgi:acetolactate synthase regulatory subunit
VPLVFSPLSEELLASPPKALLPKRVFVMRQLGDPPEIDLAMNAEVVRLCRDRGFEATDASDTTGSKDYLERILSLIRATGFTAAIFSHETRANSIANIALELGFAAMCGKPLVIVKSPEATAPSDLKRTDWIEYDGADLTLFRRKLGQAIDEIERLCNYEDVLLRTSLDARSPDCAIGLERAIKGFLLSGDARFVTAAEQLLEILNIVEDTSLGDLERLRSETRTFIRQARDALNNLPAVEAAPLPSLAQRKGRRARPG